ncbi:MAG: flagellar biosynthetic protein FliR, partial [Oscillospiraceae bacterium]|nr:flagellar biosynthetic protein FliR [Oscillospiraceae bacterium]
MTVSFDGFYIYVLVFARLAGLVFFNPLLSRRNVPTQIRAGLVLLLTILVSPSVDASAVTPDSFDLIIGIIKELFIGFLCGFVYQVFYYLLLFAGDWLDTEFGMAMAKVFDPATNMQISVTGNLLTLLFTCYLFA